MKSAVLTVTELTRNIKDALEGEFNQVYIQGEISNLARPSSGHLYFNLKDDKSQISGVMFRSVVAKTRFELENGLEVIIRGRVTVYEPRGVYQVIVDKADPLGAGALQLAFEQLKIKLGKEGLFDPSHKKELPFIPKGIGVITSPTGAAVQDILNILDRRFPGLPVLINPVPVQGVLAAPEISAAIKQFQDIPEIDLLIVGRGGGSIEDLWAFNEEEVVRAIYKSTIPVISAVGHETDFTIADFVADLRAPTPSAAAELAVPVKENLKLQVNEVSRKLEMRVTQKIKNQFEKIEYFQKRLRSPQWIVQSQMQKLDEVSGRLTHQMESRLLQSETSWKGLNQRLLLKSPMNPIQLGKLHIRDLRQQLVQNIEKNLEKRKSRLTELTHVLDTVSPISAAARGYAAISNKEGSLITSISQVSEKSDFKVHLTDGVLKSKVEKIIPRHTKK